jgi:hypothetical protein
MKSVSDNRSNNNVCNTERTCGYHNWGNNNPTEPAVRSFEMADGAKFNWLAYSR